jgi:hypothetical protein
MLVSSRSSVVVVALARIRTGALGELGGGEDDLVLLGRIGIWDPEWGCLRCHTASF